MSAGSVSSISETPHFVRSGPPVAILLSLYNGEAFLSRQLDSFLEQEHHNWLLLWRDDGSSDSSRAILKAFQANRGAGRCVEADSESGINIGIAASYWQLLTQVPDGYLVAFADQDDVWLPDKISRGVTALKDVPESKPALYFGRQILTDRFLNPLMISPAVKNLQGIFSALAQNVATGCTVMLNKRALHLLKIMGPFPPSILHDWAAYLAVIAAGGVVYIDSRPVVLYRQHATNAVGARPSWFRRGYAAVRRGPEVFMTIFRSNIAWLLNNREFLDPSVVSILKIMQKNLTGTRLDRLRLLTQYPELSRTGLSENFLFRLWFISAKAQASFFEPEDEGGHDMDC
ncbi:glycosyltransferase [Acetobacter musti]|nr:glycosyltransferase [Acetobacter musti]